MATDYHAARPGWWFTCAVLLLLLVASPAAAQYAQLQVLLPGESPAPGTTLGKNGAPTPQTVGEPFTVTVRACDAGWNTVTAITHQVALDATDETASLPASVTLSGGEASFSVTLNATGSFTFSGDDLTDTTIPVAQSASVTAFLLAGFEFDRINQKNQYAGQAMNITLTAVDPSGDPVPGFAGQIRLRQITSFGEGRISPDLVNMSGGSWTGNVTMYRADETAINRGNVNILAEFVNDPTKNGTSDPFSVHPGNAARVQLVVPGQDPLPGSVDGVSGNPASQAAGQAFAVSAFLTDQYWNPLPGSDQVRITSSDPQFTPVSGNLNNGFREFTVALNTTGTQTLSITDQSNGSIQGMTTVGIAVGFSSAQQFIINGIPAGVTAGEAVPVTIIAADQGGNQVPTFNGDARLSANTGPGSITPEDISFTNGQWSGDMVFRGAGGAVSFTCSDFSSPPHTGTSSPFVVSAGPLAGLQVLAPGEAPAGGTVSGVSGLPTPQNAGSSFSFTVRAVDAFWNRVPGSTNQVALSSSDSFAGIPEEITLVNGERAVNGTLYRAGVQTITATDLDSTDVGSHTSTGIPVDAGAHAAIVLVAPGESLAPGAEEGRDGTATDQSINFAFTVTAYATDAWYNRVYGVTDIVRLTSGDPLAQLPGDTPMVDGRADMSMRLSTGGFQQITAQDVSQPGFAPSTTQVRAISSGFHLEAEITPTTVAAGDPFQLTVKVTNDAGSVIQEFNSSVTLTVQNASSGNPGAGTLLTTEFQLLQGQRTVSQTYTRAEPIVIVATDDAGNVPAVTEVLTVTPGAPAQVVLESDPPWVRGNKTSNVTATVVDAFDNGVPGQPVQFSLVGGGGTLTALENTTDGSGAARAEFLSPRTPQISRMRAASNALVTELDIETALVDPNAPGGTVTNYPNPFHPGESPTTIAYKLADDATVTMRVFTLSGDLVLQREFVAGTVGGTVGLNEIVWDGKNGDGTTVATGGYVVELRAEGSGETLHLMRRKVGVVR